MAKIYKITNTVNNKAYIGKTNDCIFKRFSEHISESTRERSKDRPIYRAIKKYGIQNFSLELLEITDKPEEREIFWISHFNTYRSGYNATKGGDGRSYIDESAILNFHSLGLSIQLISEKTGNDRATVAKVIQKHGLDANPHSHRAKKNKVRCVESGMVFDSQKAVADFLKPVCSNNERDSIANKISLCCRKIRKTAYGFSWEYVTPL